MKNRDISLAVFNLTDGVFAASERFGSRREAKVFIRDFRKRYAQQGYYLTANRERIAVDAVELIIMEMET